MFVICIEVIIYLLLYNLHDRTFNDHYVSIVKNSYKEKSRNYVSDTNFLTDKIPPTIVKFSTTVFSQPLAGAINNSISKGVFPYYAKVASVSPVDKQSNDKNKVLNFRPVCALNIFSKIYASVTKSQLTLALNNTFSPYIAAYLHTTYTQQIT